MIQYKIPNATAAKIIFPSQPNFVTSYTDTASISNAGNLPNELAAKKTAKETFPTAAAKVIKPEGTNGINLREKTREKAFLLSASTNCFTLGYWYSLFAAILLNPFRYNKNEMAAPMASPKKEISVPFQKPKKSRLAAVIKTLGNMPMIAIMILKQMLMITASWGYSLNN
jgi:hypothetical protein